MATENRAYPIKVEVLKRYATNSFDRALLVEDELKAAGLSTDNIGLLIAGLMGLKHYVEGENPEANNILRQ